MDYSRIKIELDKKKMSIRDLCYKIDVTEQGLHQMIRNKSMKVEVLERISRVLDKPVSYWFSEELEGVYAAVNANGSINSRNGDADANVIGTQVAPTIIHQKIDSLTKNLNEMLKDIISKQ
jgi:transcriptional regulator with XRE-family HTH domain